MLAVCIARHHILSEHLCSFFSTAGIECVPAVGVRDGVNAVRARYPDVAICDYDLLSVAVLREWEQEEQLAEIPIVAVSLTRRPEEARLVGHGAVVSFLYLPAVAGQEIESTLRSASAVASRVRGARERPNEPGARF